MAKYYGWAGTTLDVDLTRGTIERQPLPRDWAEKDVGGLAFGSRVLYDHVGPEVDPLSPDNVMVILTGSLNGTGAPSCGRCDLVTRSPLTGIFLRSNLGGFFGPELKWAGYDFINVHGRAERPVWLWIKDDHVELRDATHLWGKDTWTTEHIIRAELGDPDVKTLKIGPAGENQCYSSAVIADLGRAAGKCSSAAVWGAKNLKAIAVRGSKGVAIARPKEMLSIVKELLERFKKDPMYAAHAKYGTNWWVGDTVMKGIGRAIGRDIAPHLSAEALQKFYEKNLSCPQCPMHCSHFYRVKSGPYAGTAGEGIEGNTQMVGAEWGGTDASLTLHYNNLCNQLGLDTMHPGGAINFAMRLYKDGIITKEDTGGLELVPGTADVILKLVHQIAYRQGFGAIIDGYPVRAAQKIGRGSELYAGHVKGYPCGGEGFMSSVKTTLAHAVATRAHDHLTGSPGIESPNRQPEMTNEILERIGQERYGDPKWLTDAPWNYQPKYARSVYDCENLFAMSDSVGGCKFVARECMYVEGLNLSDYARLMSASTGIEFTLQDMLYSANREMARERAYNARIGIRKIDDYPYAFSWELKNGKPHPRFNPARYRMKLEDYTSTLNDYYRLRGCDVDTGIPTRETLEKYGLKAIADDLAARSVLAK